MPKIELVDCRAESGDPARRLRLVPPPASPPATTTAGLSRRVGVGIATDRASPTWAAEARCCRCTGPTVCRTSRATRGTSAAGRIAARCIPTSRARRTVRRAARATVVLGVAAGATSVGATRTASTARRAGAADGVTGTRTTRAARTTRPAGRRATGSTSATRAAGRRTARCTRAASAASTR